MNLPIQQLLQKIQFLDDQNSFKQLYQLLFFKLYQFAYSFVQSKESAEEVVNDVFLCVWQKRKTLDTINNINVYLYVAVKNASLNYLRKNNLHIPLSLDDLVTYHLRITANPESIMITRELELSIRKAIEQLPPKCKIIFKMIKYDGLSYKEVAAILGISVKTVDTQLYIALKKLAHIIQPVRTEGSTGSRPFPTSQNLPNE
jgi:RNA polymerase sigma-70 factor (ECF subfamily)